MTPINRRPNPPTIHIRRRLLYLCNMVLQRLRQAVILRLHPRIRLAFYFGRLTAFLLPPTLAAVDLTGRGEDMVFGRPFSIRDTSHGGRR